MTNLVLARLGDTGPSHNQKVPSYSKDKHIPYAKWHSVSTFDVTELGAFAKGSEEVSPNIDHLMSSNPLG